MLFVSTEEINRVTLKSNLYLFHTDVEVGRDVPINLSLFI